ncbi:Diphthamide biosynthesis protein 2 [Ceratobasidium sp. 414]|nr:Diphthamide biosynthesis protein 2 [Ceratobasidium sp. 414]
MSVVQPPSTGAFSTAGEEAINRTVEIKENELTSDEVQPDNIDDLFEISETFPDELLGVSVPIYIRLKQLLGDGRDAYVLADTTYGSCCVDEVAAAHIDADVVIHYGHTCLSPYADLAMTSRLPVIYVFGKRHLDMDDCVSQFANIAQQYFGSLGAKSTLLVKIDVSYTHRTDVLKDALQRRFPSVNVVSPTIHRKYTPPAASSAQAPYAPADPEQPSESLPSPTREPDLSSPTKPVETEHSIEDSIILYIGSESLALTNFLLTHAQSEVISYDPQARTIRRETGSVNKLLMRRYAIIQKARDADVFGILVGTLGVGKCNFYPSYVARNHEIIRSASYIPLMTHLRRILSKAQKKSYTISVGKLNPAKLANFMEIECFVLVACPENSVIDSKEFYRPIVTPFELEIALGEGRSWTGEYILDFDQILKGGEGQEDITREQEADSGDDPDRPAFSLITGTYRHAKRYGDPRDDTVTDSSGSAVALRNNEGALSQVSTSAASDFLHTRSFQGLEQRLGQDAPSILEQGRSGIAKGYKDVDHSPT